MRCLAASCPSASSSSAGADAAGDYIDLKFYVNGAAYTKGDGTQRSVVYTAGADNYVANTSVFNLSATDYVECYAYHNLGTSRQCGAATAGHQFCSFAFVVWFVVLRGKIYALFCCLCLLAWFISARSRRDLGGSWDGLSCHFFAGFANTDVDVTI